MSTAARQPGAGVAATSSGTDADAERYRDRIQRLTTLAEDVECERDLAMLRAHQHGVTTERIARLALTDPADVERRIAELSREPDVDQWGDGPDWIRYHPRPW